MRSICLTACRFHLARRCTAHEAPDLRSFFGDALADSIQSSFYDDRGQAVFDYPRLQFKLIETTATLLGLAEGAAFLQRIRRELEAPSVGGEQFEILDVDWETQDAEIAVTTEPREYRFVTPWLGLNQKNFRAYVGSRHRGFRKDELSRILVGNCLGMLKSLGIESREWVAADGRSLTSIKTSSSGKSAIGFVGKFQINLQLPDDIGLGRLTTRGFGTITSA
jgi:hypothetical protein